jgi:hypothetical protein
MHLRAFPLYHVTTQISRKPDTVGLTLALAPAVRNLAAAVILGAMVGALKVFNRDRPILAAPLSVVAAALVSVFVFLAVKQGLPVDPQYALVPPLVTFLPGAMLTFGMVELAYGDMVSGSSRLIRGFVQLVLLAFGLTAGAALVGYSAENLIDATKCPRTTPGEDSVRHDPGQNLVVR